VVQLRGTAHAHVGSLEPSGTFTATVSSNGQAKVQLSIGELSRTETTEPSSAGKKCKWAGEDSVEHDVSHHNCQLAVSWLLPLLDLQARSSTLHHTLEADSHNSSGQLLSLSEPAGNDSAPALFISQLSNAKLELDPTTFLPQSLSFNIHPDKDARTDIPIIVRYSDYRRVDGATLPFHIEKYLNNGPVLDLQVETAEVQQ
jgi:hypothetical protein